MKREARQRRIAIALLLLLAVPANAQDRSAPGAGSIFHDAHGRVTGSARIDHVPRRQRARHRFDQE